MPKIGKVCRALLASVAFVSSSFAEESVTLPAGYDLLEYVESTGLQYIDLRLKPDDTMTSSRIWEGKRTPYSSSAVARLFKTMRFI